jgi:hypothetical protein
MGTYLEATVAAQDKAPDSYLNTGTQSMVPQTQRRRINGEGDR